MTARPEDCVPVADIIEINRAQIDMQTGNWKLDIEFAASVPGADAPRYHWVRDLMRALENGGYPGALRISAWRKSQAEYDRELGIDPGPQIAIGDVRDDPRGVLCHHRRINPTPFHPERGFYMKEEIVMGRNNETCPNLPQNAAENATGGSERVSGGSGEQGGLKSAPAGSVITTPEELDALPVGSVVMSRAFIDGSRMTATRGAAEDNCKDFDWEVSGQDGRYSVSGVVEELTLPLTVLYRPDQDSIDVDELAEVIHRVHFLDIADSEAISETVKAWLVGGAR